MRLETLEQQVAITNAAVQSQLAAVTSGLASSQAALLSQITSVAVQADDNWASGNALWDNITAM